jgi:hypothetical protein
MVLWIITAIATDCLHAILAGREGTQIILSLTNAKGAKWGYIRLSFWLPTNQCASDVRKARFPTDWV